MTGGIRRRAAVAVATLGAVLAGTALALAPLTAASAHDYLVDADPAVGSSVTTPVDKITLTFSDVVLKLGNDGSSSILQVTDAAGLHYETACAATQGRNVIVPVTLGEAGTYTVTFQIVSADGHTVSDDYTFDYTPPTDSEPASGTERSVCATAQEVSTAPPATGQDDAAADREAGSAALGTVLTIVGVIFALVVIGVLAALIFARKKPRA